MSDISASKRLNCPRCGEIVSSEDKFCFHCGRRLPPKPEVVSRPPSRRGWWLLGILAVLVFLAGGYQMYHQSRVIASLNRQVRRLNASLKSYQSGQFHPVVTTTTSYPTGVSSSADWTPELEAYANVQFGLRVPNGMNQTLHASPSDWIWGEPHSPYQVALSVVGVKPAAASVVLGANTYGTTISRMAGTASQQLYVNWAPHKWVEVSMAVPASHTNWLEAIATSVQIS